MKQETMMSIYNRTLKNCKFYQAEGMESSLLNEIGVLRGIAYCLELAGFNTCDLPEFLDFIEIQNTITNKDWHRIYDEIAERRAHT